MDVVTKSASVATIESEHPNGEFEVVLSTESLDRDDENLWADEWKQPLPARIHIDGDHGRTLEKTVGSAIPRIEGNRMVAKGTYAGTEYAQMVRQLVNEGHINSVSVTYAERKNQKNDGVQRELLNAAFVAIPANPEAVVLASKSAKLPSRNKAMFEVLKQYVGDTAAFKIAEGTLTPDEAKEFFSKAEGGFTASGDNPTIKHDQMVQAIHDAAYQLGAECANEIEADPGTDEGGNKSATEIYQWGRDLVATLHQKTSTSKEAGLPQESPDGSPAEAATKAAAAAPAEVPADAAEKSADDAEHKAKDAAAKARALAFLISKNAPQEG